MGELGVLASVVTAGMTFPLALWIARSCLRGVMWVLRHP